MSLLCKEVLKSFRSGFIILPATIWVFAMVTPALGSTSISIPGGEKSAKMDEEKILLAQCDDCQMGQHRGGRHMGRGRGCEQGGMGQRGGMGCGPGGKGPRGPMQHGMRHGGGQDVKAECPQSRSTANAPEQYYGQANPLEKNAGNIEQGRLLYQLNAQPTCTMCHGLKGDGQGMMGGGMNPPPRNFACAETMDALPDGQLFWIIKNGSAGTGMPAFSDLRDAQVWQLILFLRTLSK